jgi:hypothetical protein
MSKQWEGSGLACRSCGWEVSKSIAHRTGGYCDECGRRLYSLNNGQQNPYPMKHKARKGAP